MLSDKGAKVSEAYGTALDIPYLGRFSNRQTYIISPVRNRTPELLGAERSMGRAIVLVVCGPLAAA